MGRENIIIGLSGKPGTGKSLVVDYLARRYGIENHIEMSDGVIAIARVMLKAADMEYYPDRKEEFRQLLQFIGNHWRVEFGVDYWLKAIDKIQPPASIGGIRYPNEVVRIQQRGGVVWRLQRQLAANSDKAATEVQLDNFDRFDAVISNDSTIEDLYNRIDQEMEKLVK